jgi:transcriptional regulator with XRE-family HTH domain
VVDDDEAAHRSDPLDTHFAANMTRLREAAGISQAEMVHKLREEGWTNVHPTTISRIEKGERPVKLNEAARIAAVLGQDLPRMLAPPGRAGIEEEVDKAIESVTNFYNCIGESVFLLTTYREVLGIKLAEFRAVVDRENDDRLREKLTQSERYLALRVDNAVKAGREASSARSFVLYDTPGWWLRGGRSEFIDRYGFTPDRAPESVDEEDINAPTA